jgi:ankyrin repeat protein
LEHGANLHAQGDDAVFWPFIQGYKELVALYKERGVRLSKNDELIYACRWGDIALVRKLLEAGEVNVHHRDEQAFILAVRHGHHDIVSLLISHGANLDEHGFSALVLAIDMGSLSIVKTLVASGVDPHNRDEYALLLASKNGKLEIVRYLVERPRCDIHARDEAALITAVDYGHIEIMKLLLEHGANVQARNNCALRLAAGKGRLKLVNVILENGANVDDTDELFSEDALTLATLHGHTAVVKILRDAGAKYHHERILKSLVLLSYDSEVFDTIIAQLDFETSLDTLKRQDYCFKALLNACAQGHHKNANYLLKKFKFTQEHMLEAIRWAANREDVALLRTLFFYASNQ